MKLKNIESYWLLLNYLDTFCLCLQAAAVSHFLSHLHACPSWFHGPFCCFLAVSSDLSPLFTTALPAVTWLFYAHPAETGGAAKSRVHLAGRVGAPLPVYELVRASFHNFWPRFMRRAARSTVPREARTAAEIVHIAAGPLITAGNGSFWRSFDQVQLCLPCIIL